MNGIYIGVEIKSDGQVVVHMPNHLEPEKLADRAPELVGQLELLKAMVTDVFLTVAERK